MNPSSFTDGVYSGLILDHRLERASTGTPQFVMTFRIVGKVGDDGHVKPCPLAERTLQHSIGNEKSIQRFILEFRRVFRIENLNQLAHKGQGGSSLVGQPIKVTCHQEPFGDRMVERWSILRNEPLAADEVQGLQDRFGDVLRTMNARFGPTANGIAGPTPGDHEVPAEPAARGAGQPAAAQTA